jgi:phenylacetate-CoA ligase
MCANIVECELGELHLKLEHSFVEILNDKNEEVKPGEEGRLVCTGFGNYAFPLIRYDIKDIVRLSKNQKSKCGRGGIIIEEIIGRVEDYVVTPDGRYIGRLDHIFKDSVNVREAQLVQKDVNELLIRIVPEKSYSSEDEKKIFDEVKLRLGSSMRIRIEYVDKIEREKNGKFRFVINELLNANKLSV